MVKLVVSILFLGGAFAGIYWFTSPSRCSSSYDGDLSGLLGDDSAYNMCTNYYDMPIFKDNDKALLKAKEDFAEALSIIDSSYKIGVVSSSNYEQYLAYGLELHMGDAVIDGKIDGLVQFLGIYDNALKRAKPYLECVFTKTFYVIDAMDHYENDKSYNYVILKNPNTLEPMMIKLANEQKLKFETGLYFEVSFINDKKYTGSYSDYVKLFEKLAIKDIQVTSRENGNQLQEQGCR